MVDLELLTKQLQLQVPQTHISTEPSLLRASATDGAEPGMVITPATIDDTARVIHILKHYPLSLLPLGNGTHTGNGGLPEHIDILLKTTALNNIVEHEAPDLTCQVEAGITLATLQDQLATRGQMLALDPPDAHKRTIGGIIASNASGPKRLRYGTARDLVIGLRVIQANGEITRSGGRVVKNVAGYDLNKLYIGSLGTLGIIVEANFKLHPLPEAEKTLLFTFTQSADAMQTALALLQSPLTPSAIEPISTNIDHTAYEFRDVAPNTGYTLAVNFEGSTIAITRQINETLQLARHATKNNALEGQKQGEFWQAVRNCMQGQLICKVCVLASQVSGYIEYVERICQNNQLEATIVAHAGNGILYIKFNTYDVISQVAKVITDLRVLADQMRGSLVVEQCPTSLKQHLNVWGKTHADFYLMQRLKQQFDPQGLFVKGRFLGGL